MKRMKRIVALLLCAVIAGGVLGGCKAKNDGSDDNTEQYITRGAWVEAIGSIWGMDEYVEDVPYFTDVPSDSEIFPYVQACYEWNVISTGTDEFKQNDVATLGFAVSSAVMILHSAEIEMSNAQLIDKAVEYGIMDQKENTPEALREGITAQQADRIIALTQVIYLSTDDEIINEIVVNDTVADYSDETEKIQKDDEGRYIIDEDIAENLENGAVFMAPAEAAMGGQAAVKVLSKTDNGDGTYTVQTDVPEAEEVFEELQVKGTYYADYELIEPAEGVEVLPLESTERIGFYSDGKNMGTTGAAAILRTGDQGSGMRTAGKSDKSNFVFKVELKGGSGGTKVNMEASSGDDKFGISIDDKGIPTFKNTDKAWMGSDDKLEVECEMKGIDADAAEMLKDMNINAKKLMDGEAMENLANYSKGLISYDSLHDKITKTKLSELKENGTFKSGYTISGSVEVKNLSVTTDIDIKKILKFKSASVKVKGEVTNKLSVKGKASAEIPIAKIPIVTVGVASVNLDLYLYGEINGELSLTYKVTLDTMVEMKSGCEPRKESNISIEQSVEAKVTLEAGVGAAIAVYVAGIEIVSVKLKAGILLSASLTCTIKNELHEDGDKIVCAQKGTLKPEIYLYLPIIKIELNNTKNCFLGKLGLKATWTISDKKSIDAGHKKGSGFGKLCSRIELLSREITLYTITIKVPKYDETENETNLGDYLSLDHIVLAVETGESAILSVENKPIGYEAEDIVWISDNPAVATVKNGTVTGIAEGSATITVKTSDGKYEITCLVSVYE